MRLVLEATLLAVCVLTFGPSGRGEDKKVSIEGTYLLVGVEVEGKPLPEKFITEQTDADRTIKIAADKFIATKDGKEEPATYKIDTSKTPYQIELNAKKDNNREEKLYGI